MKSIEKVLVSAVIVSIAFSTLVMPVFAGNSKVTPDTLRATLESGYTSYLTSIGMSTRAITDEQTADNYFLQFLNAKPKYQSTLQQYDALTTNPGIMKQLALPDFSVINLGPVISTFNTTINGVPYTVELRQGTLADGTTVVKATYIGPDGITDPWVYVAISYLKVQILWWTVTYGEDQWLYEHYVTNSGGVNEALIFRAKIDDQSIQQLAIAGIVGLIAGALTSLVGCPGCGGIVGILSGYQTGWFKNTIDTAYDSTNGEYVAMQNHYLYTQIGSYMTVWAWYYFSSSWHKALPAPGLELFSLTTTTSWIMSGVYHKAGDTYGYNRWVWVGTYRG